MEATAQQIAEWNRFSNYFRTSVRKSMESAIAGCELAASLQTLCEEYGFNLTSPVFDSSDETKIKELIDTYNRMDRCISKVEIGSYSVRFENDDIDILVDPQTNPEAIQADRIEGFQGVGLTILAIGLVVAAGVWAISKLIEAHNKMINSMMKQRALDLLAEQDHMPQQTKDALNALLKDNKPKIKKAGWIDAIFGTGSGGMIVAALGVAFLLFAYMKGRK